MHFHSTNIHMLFKCIRQATQELCILWQNAGKKIHLGVFVRTLRLKKISLGSAISGPGITLSGCLALLRCDIARAVFDRAGPPLVSAPSLGRCDLQSRHMSNINNCACFPNMPHHRLTLRKEAGHMSTPLGLTS